MEDSRSLPVRWAYRSVGVCFVALGFAGAVLPLLPSTIFFILALWAFKRGSPRLETWLLEHRVVGPVLRDWNNGGKVSRRGKVAATTSIWVCLAISALFVSLLGKGVLLATGLALTVFLLTRPE